MLIGTDHDSMMIKNDDDDNDDYDYDYCNDDDDDDDDWHYIENYDDNDYYNGDG